MYDIISSNNVKTLMERVNSKIKEGFLPLGGVGVINYDEGGYILIQAVYKEG